MPLSTILIFFNFLYIKPWLRKLGLLTCLMGKQSFCLPQRWCGRLRYYSWLSVSWDHVSLETYFSKPGTWYLRSSWIFIWLSRIMQEIVLKYAMAIPCYIHILYKSPWITHILDSSTSCTTSSHPLMFFMRSYYEGSFRNKRIDGEGQGLYR